MLKDLKNTYSRKGRSSKRFFLLNYRSI